MTMSFLLNSALCIDLVRVLWNPFKSTDNRSTKYLAICGTLTACALTGLNISYYILDSVTFAKVGTVIQFLPVVIFSVCAIFSFSYALYKLNRPGISPEIRNFVLRRHIYTVLFYFIVNLYFISSMTLWIIYGFDLRKMDVKGTDDFLYYLKIIF